MKRCRLGCQSAILTDGWIHRTWRGGGCRNDFVRLIDLWDDRRVCFSWLWHLNPRRVLCHLVPNAAFADFRR